MTATLILEQLARELSVDAAHIRAVFEMVDAGLSAPFIGRFRREATGGLSETQIRRLQNRRLELEELDRRRGTILRTLEKEGITDPQAVGAIERCADRFELEDLFVPHRRPEPEVQLALDRGLGALADALIAPVPRTEDTSASTSSPASPESSGEADPETPSGTTETPAPAGELVGDGGESTPSSEPSGGATGDDATGEGETSTPAASEIPSEAPTPDSTSSSTDTGEAPVSSTGEVEAPPVSPTPGPDAPLIGGLHVEITPELARLCQIYVAPDRGVHTENEALSGAVRILSDRLGRNAGLRTMVRRMLRKRGVLSVKPLVPESKAGRHKPLLRMQKPLRQIQGHRLLAIRQAQKERVLGTSITLDPKQVVGKVRAAFGKHTRPEFEALLSSVAAQALQARLLPVVEADVRLEVKERGDHEALRFLSQHLRQVLLTPPSGRHPVVSVDVNAKGDWTLVTLDGDGAVLSKARIEVGDKDPAALAEELRPLIADHDARLLGVGHGKGPRAAVPKLRAAVAAGNLDTTVTIVNEAGVSSYANSPLAREELSDFSVPERMAISLGRRLQDPMAEILKVDPRHLSLGSEQGLVSKANARRAFDETIESSVAHVGCDLNAAPRSVLRCVPGLDDATVDKLLAARAERPFETRDQLRTEGVLTEAQWTSAVAFLRIPGSPQPLDRTSLHPELYPLAVRVLESTGQSVEESLGRPGVTKGLRRAAFEVDQHTWRDLMRELSHPGRDPRPRLRRAELLAPDADPARATEGRVIEGIVTNVTSFGAFVDIGLEQDAMLHISEISERYVRDARELLSIGQTVRARILPSKGSRLTLSLKNVPKPERKPRGGGRDRRGGGKGKRDSRPKQLGRGALLGSSRSRRGGPGRGDRRDRHGDRLSREERADLERVNEASKAAAYNPFAEFFNKDAGGEEGSDQDSSSSSSSG